jgi:hypothetical protein
MDRIVCGMLILTGGLLAAGQTAAAQASNSAITIAVKNYARVDNETLMRAEGVAVKIFRKAGVETRWVDLAITPEVQQEASTDLQPFIFQIQLSIIPSAMADRLGLPTDVMGLAPGAEPDRRMVYVFYSSIEALAQRQKEARISEASSSNFG